MKGYTIGHVIEAVKFTREAADVSRFHINVIHGEYSVGHHSFNMLTMLRLLYPDPPIELVWAVIEHDMPERLTGDIPAPAKWFNIVDNIKLAQLEQEINEMIFGEAYEHSLSAEGTAWLKGLDLLELYLFCKDQLMLGNSNLITVHDRIEKFFESNLSLFAPELIDFYYYVKDYDWSRMPDLGEEK